MNFFKSQPFIDIHCYMLRFSKTSGSGKSLRMHTVVAHNLEALASQLSRNGLEEIWSPYFNQVKIYQAKCWPITKIIADLNSPHQDTYF